MNIYQTLSFIRLCFHSSFDVKFETNDFTVSHKLSRWQLKFMKFLTHTNFRADSAYDTLPDVDILDFFFGSFLRWRYSHYHFIYKKFMQISTCQLHLIWGNCPECLTWFISGMFWQLNYSDLSNNYATTIEFLGFDWNMTDIILFKFWHHKNTHDNFTCQNKSLQNLLD